VWGGNGKNTENYQKILKNSTIYPLPGGGNGKIDQKLAKKGRKIAFLSLYLLYLYHV